MRTRTRALPSTRWRQERVFPAAPVPSALLNAFDPGHGIRELQAGLGKGRGDRLWPVVAHDRLSRDARSDAARRVGRAAGFAQGPQARFWGGGGASPR